MKCWLAFACGSMLLATTLPAGETVDYERQIKPLLAQKCFSCHGALRQESGLRLDASSLILKGGSGGVVLVPGKVDESQLVERVSSNDPDLRMPPEGEGELLDADQIALVKAWITSGATMPAGEPIPPDPREHWAYRVPVRPPVPQTSRDGQLHHPIDAFIAAAYEKQHLVPVEPAAKHVLLRRAYIDLIGLPPTREQLRAFLADDSPRAYEETVDRLLESTHYGERWGRHWMDVWRYSDWSGYRDQIRNSQRHIWRWRDWIIESLNADKGYDRMVVEMLAGDEIAPTDPATLRATGYLARNWYKYSRNYWLDQTIEHTSKAFLAQTMNCARCHDHKYDPVAQTNYYQMRALFEPHDVRTDQIPGQSDLLKDGLPRVFDAHPEAKTFLFVRGNEKQPDESHPLVPSLPAVFGSELGIKPVDLPVEAYYPYIRDHVVQNMLAAERTKLATAQNDIEKSKQALTVAKNKITLLPIADASPADSKPKDEKPADAAPDRSTAQQAVEDAERGVVLAEAKLAVSEASLLSLQARIAADRAKYLRPENSKLDELSKAAGAFGPVLAKQQAVVALLTAKQSLITAQRAAKSDSKKSQEAVDKAQQAVAAAEKKLQSAQAVVEKPTAQYAPLGNEYPRTSTGRRLALARWIANPKNPLTARVAVNHIWMRHFGAPLVDNVFDFGLRTPPSRHAELLDWLAAELVENNWSMKHLHRIIVTSNTYRLASSSRKADATNLKRDPDNRYLWRMNSRRLEAEMVRDALLYVAGNLDTAFGGPDIDENQGQKSRRRSLYFRHAYEKKMKFLELFDGASENECYRRSESILPQQALALSNSAVGLSQSRVLAGKLSTEAPDGDKFIDLAFLQLFCRQPTTDELATCREFLSTQAALFTEPAKLSQFAGGPAATVKPSADPQQRARENLVHVLMNHNDFVTVR